MSGASRLGAGPGASRRLSRILTYVPVRWGWFATETHVRSHGARMAIERMMADSTRSLASLPKAGGRTPVGATPSLDPSVLEPVVLDGTRCMVVMQDGRPRGAAAPDEHFFVAGNQIRIAVTQGVPTMVGIDRDTGTLATFDGTPSDPTMFRHMAILQGRTAHLMEDALSYQASVMLRHPAPGTLARRSLSAHQSNALDDVAAHVEALARSIRTTAAWSMAGAIDETARRSIAGMSDVVARSGHDPHMHVACGAVEDARRTVPCIPGLDILSHEAGLDYMRWSTPSDGVPIHSSMAVGRLSALLLRQRGTARIEMVDMALLHGVDDVAIRAVRGLVATRPGRDFAPAAPQLRIMEHGLLEVAVIERSRGLDISAFVTRLH